MRQRFWQWLARFITGHPAIVHWLIHRAFKTPYSHIDDYMGRWWLMPRCLLTKDEHGNLFPHAWLPFSVRIHHIMRADNERDLHDHPFNYRTIILQGWYHEEDVFGQMHVRHQGDTAAACAQTFHRIAEVPKKGVWTLFIMGPRINSWGFMVGGRKVHWRKYIGVEA
jgi:hypothetical protein